MALTLHTRFQEGGDFLFHEFVNILSTFGCVGQVDDVDVSVARATR
jgi:hypothetical protein